MGAFASLPRHLRTPGKSPEMVRFKSRIYEGRVFHHRLRPRKHRLAYRVFSFFLDLEELPELNSKLKLFSFNRFNLFSFREKDYGPGTDTPLIDYVRTTLHEADVKDADGPVRLLCYPRLFGYAFNPLSVYYCYSKQEQLRAVIYEVSNTFGERHSYLIPLGDDKQGKSYHACDKVFYVSPFMEMEARYHFRITHPDDSITVFIDQHDGQGSMLKASFSGRVQTLSDYDLIRILFKYPLMSVKVIAGIHWEAWKLWRKGIKIVDRPLPPDHPITYVK